MAGLEAWSFTKNRRLNYDHPRRKHHRHFAPGLAAYLPEIRATNLPPLRNVVSIAKAGNVAGIAHGYDFRVCALAFEMQRTKDIMRMNGTWFCNARPMEIVAVFFKQKNKTK